MADVSPRFCGGLVRSLCFGFASWSCRARCLWEQSAPKGFMSVVPLEPLHMVSLGAGLGRNMGVSHNADG